MSEYGDEGLDKEENEGKPNLKQEKEENDDNYLKDDWEPVDDKFEEHTVEDKWEPVDPSMDNMRENNIKSRKDKEIEKIKKIYDPHEYEQLLEQEAEKTMARIANERMNKAIEEYKIAKVKIGELIDQPIIGKSNEGHNREALKNYIVWFLKNERNAFIDPPPGVYKIIKQVKVQLKNYDAAYENKAGLLTSYPTLQFMNDLIEDLSIIVPKDILRRDSGKLGITKASILLGRNHAHLSNIKHKITDIMHRKYNPNYKFSEEELDYFRDSLYKKYSNKASKCFEIIENYRKKNKLKKYPNQIEGINYKFFNEIDSPEKSYWYGFITDGYLDKKRGRLELELSRIDEDHLKKFCAVLGLDPNKYLKPRDRYDKRTGNTYKMARVVISDKYLIRDIIKHGYGGSKEKNKKLPDFIENLDDTPNNPIALAWLYGIYDAEGREGQSCFYAADKPFLKRIKKKYKLKNPVLRSGKNIDYWYIFVGARNANKMIGSYNKGLTRKIKVFDVSKEGLDILKESLIEHGIGKKEFKELINFFTKDELITLFDTSYKIMTNLMDEWGVELMPSGYWSTIEGKEIKKNRVKLLKNTDYFAYLDKL
jgi:hypothetical protein